MTEALAPDAEGCYVLLDSVPTADGVVETFQPTEHSRSGWGPGMQHGGPIGALLTRAVERAFPRDDVRISRVSVEILGVVPTSPVRVRAWAERPGRRIELLSAQMQAQDEDGDWRPVATAAVWRLATQDTTAVSRQADALVTLPDLAHPNGLGLDPAWNLGFVNAIQWHVQTPMMNPEGPTLAWMRLVQPIVHGELPSPAQQVVAISDVANGVGARLDPREWTYLNTDLTVHLFGLPSGPWIGLEAETSVGPDGIGLSAATIHAAQGPIGRVAQGLLIQRR